MGRPYRIAVAIGAALSGVTLILLGQFLFAHPESAIDFSNYYAAAEAYLHGHSVYGPGHELEYLYPPAFLVLVEPLTLLPLGPALVLWSGIQLAAVDFALMWTLRRRLMRPHLALTLAFLPLWFPAFMGLRFGQVSGILVVGWLMFGHELGGGRDLRAGLWLSLLAIKPPLLLVPLSLLTYLGSGRALIGLLLGGFVWFLVSIVLAGSHGLLDYLRTLFVAAGAQTSDPVYRTSTYSWASISNMFPSQGWLLLLVADALTIALALRLSRGRSLQDCVAIATPAMLLASPHVLVYDLLPLVSTIPALLRKGRALKCFVLVVAFTAIPIAHIVFAAPQSVSLLILGLMFVPLLGPAKGAVAVEGANGVT